MAKHLGSRRGIVRLSIVVLAVIAIVVVGILVRPSATPPAAAAPEPVAAATKAAESSSSPPAAAPSPAPTASASDPGLDAPDAPENDGPGADGPDDPVTDDPVVVLDPPFDVLDPVELDEKAAFEDGVQARLVELERTEVGASGPGETKGAGVVVTVEIENTTEDPISLGDVVVDFYDDAQAPAVVNYSDLRTTGFSASLEPGKKAQATFVARLTNPTDELSITVSYEPGAPAVSFSGKL